jgi:hypothetical protein
LVITPRVSSRSAISEVVAPGSIVTVSLAPGSPGGLIWRTTHRESPPTTSRPTRRMANTKVTASLRRERPWRTYS